MKNPTLKPKTNTSPLKMDGWETMYFPFLLWLLGLFSGVFAVSFREGNHVIG